MKVLRKCADKIMEWWRQLIAPSQPTREELNRMLSESFSCFVITLFLFVFFIANPQHDRVFLYTSIASFVFAIFLLLAVFLVDRCPGFYSCAKKFRDRIAIVWILMLTAVVAFARLLEVLKVALQQEKILVIIALIAFVAYFAAYFVAILWGKVTSRPGEQRDDFGLRSHYMALSGLVYILILILWNNIRPGTVLAASWSFFAVLLVDIIPLLKVVGREQSEQRVHMRTSLGIMIAVLVMLLLGALPLLGSTLLEIFPCWYWLCGGLLLITAILLGIVVTAEQRALKQDMVR